MKEILKPSLNWLLPFLFVAAGYHHVSPESHLAIFICSCIAIIPLAKWMGVATEHLAEKVGEGLGGLLNATFGNAAELIIAIAALRAGLIDVVKASLAGSIIGNILLVLGASLFAGGVKHSMQSFNEVGVRSQATMLFLAAVALLLPGTFHRMVGPGHEAGEDFLSLEISIVLLLVYAAGLWFSLRTHKELFIGGGLDGDENFSDVEESHGDVWSVGKASFVLLLATGAIAWASEMLVGSVTHAADILGFNQIFVGVIVVAVVGNAAEHSTAILMAMKNRMNLAIGIAIGSSIQIAIFVAPLLVILSYFIAPAPMNLVFSGLEILAVITSVVIVSQIAGDGKSNWFEGLQLLAVYLLLALVFYSLPMGGDIHHAPAH